MLNVDQLNPERPRPLLRKEYDRLVASGAFEGERLELLRGTLVSMSPQDPEHARVIRDLSELLFAQIGKRARLQVQLPLALSIDSEPEPDIAVLPTGDYRKGHPKKALLVIEVATSSLRKDREIKSALYAQAHVPEYWLIDVNGRAIERFTRPARGRHLQTDRVMPPSKLSPKAFPDVEIQLKDLL